MVGLRSLARLSILTLASLSVCSPALPQIALHLSPPSQLSQAPIPSRSASQLVRYTFKDKASTASAREWLEERGEDVWRVRATTLDVSLSPSDHHSLIPGVFEPVSEEAVIEDLAAHLSTEGISHSREDAIASSAAIARLSTSPLRAVQSSASDDPIHQSYHSYESITAILQLFAAEYPEYAKLESLGRTYEGREMWAIRISNHSIPLGKHVETDWDEFAEEDGVKVSQRKKRKTKKVAMVLIAGQHAREWIAPSTALFIAHQMLLDSSTPFGAQLLNELEFVFVPVANPDGYHTTFTADRLWRKNREPVGPLEQGCYGLDLNRNWAWKFSPGSRPQPCSDSYPGSKAFQALELQALSAFLLNKENHVKSFVDLHSYGQMILFPYSYSCNDQTPDDENLFEGSIGASKALRSVHGRQYEAGSVCEVSLTSPGESLDWTYAQAKIRWSFAVEMRDSGVYGFLLPPSQIVPAGEEMKAAVDSLAKFVLHKEAGGR